MSEIIGRGAEAILKKERWNGMDCVVKERLDKSYRVKELDEKLRKERTKEEAKLLSEARRVKVPTPQVYERSENVLKVEYLEGDKVRDLIPQYGEEERKELAEDIGENITRLHNRGIIHGDLTTSNMILVEGKLYFIDFGLGYFSKSVEDKAVDLYLLWEVLKSTHPRQKNELWDGVLEAYRENSENAETVLRRVEDVGSRGRYVSER
ncbi:MAG: KEOPS complex kinase/ATPase Bud32 [Candidatus Aenigmatarchaeota archaeon]